MTCVSCLVCWGMLFVMLFFPLQGHLNFSRWRLLSLLRNTVQYCLTQDSPTGLKQNQPMLSTKDTPLLQTDKVSMMVTVHGGWQTNLEMPFRLSEPVKLFWKHYFKAEKKTVALPLQVWLWLIITNLSEYACQLEICSFPVLMPSLLLCSDVTVFLHYYGMTLIGLLTT